MGSSCQLHNLEYVLKKQYPQAFPHYLLLRKHLRVIKTPNVVDFDHPLAQMDLEDYLVDMSASVIEARVITADRRFFAMSPRAVKPEAVYRQLIETPSNETSPAVLLRAPLQPHVPFLDLKTPHLTLYPELETAFDRVIRSGWYILGQEVEAFEREFAAYWGRNTASVWAMDWRRCI